MRHLIRFALAVAVIGALAATAAARNYGGASSGDLLGYRSGSAHYHGCSAARPKALQGYRVRVYNPGNYRRTRNSMSNRAAVRAALKRKKQRRAAARNKRLRRNIN